MRPWIHLDTVAMAHHNSLLQTSIHICWGLTLTWSFFSHIENYCLIYPFLLRILTQSFPWISWNGGLRFLVALPLLLFLFYLLLPQPHLLPKGASGFPGDWFQLVYFGVTCTPSDIKNSLILVLQLLKKVETMSKGNTTSCGIASILKKNRL